MTTPPLPLGQLVKKHRQAAHLTQEQLGQRVGITREGISKIERGGTEQPTIDTLRRIANALSVPVEEFLAAQYGNAVPDHTEYDALSTRFAELMIEMEEVMRRMRRFMPGGGTGETGT